MLTKTLAIIGLIIILLSLCALLFFPAPVRSFARGSMQAGNLVDTSVQAALGEEAATVVAQLVAAAEAASSQAELDAVLATATAQAGLIDTAATAADQATLVAALEAASEGITSQIPTAIPTPAATQTAAAATATAEALANATPTPAVTDTPTLLPTPETPTPGPPTNTPTPAPPTNTPTLGPTPTAFVEAPPDGLPVTGGMLAQVVPTVVIEADWPIKTEVKHSDFIRVTLVQLSEGVYAPTIEAETERQIITVTPKPIPNSTPQAPLQSAFGDEYTGFAVAKLSYGEAVFDVNGPTPRDRQSLDQSEITWKWNLTPKEAGEQVVNLVIEVEWEPLNESAPKREPHTIWNPDLKINVAEPPLIVRGQINALGLFGTVLGAALNVPFLYNVIRDWREKRHNKEVI